MKSTVREIACNEDSLLKPAPVIEVARIKVSNGAVESGDLVVGGPLPVTHESPAPGRKVQRDGLRPRLDGVRDQEHFARVARPAEEAVALDDVRPEVLDELLDNAVVVGLRGGVASVDAEPLGSP